MSRRSLLVATLIALLLPGALLVHWMRIDPGQARFAETPPLPHEVGPWQATRQSRLADDVLAMIDPDSHLMQLYEAPGRTPIWLYVGVYAGRARYGKSAHDPEVCYPAQGWEVLRSESFAVPLGNSVMLRTKHLEAHRGSSMEVVLYWFQPAKRWPAPDAGEQLMRVLDAVRGRPQYAFVRLSGPTDGGTAAKRDLAEFAEKIALPIRAFVDNKDSLVLPDQERDHS
jgi:EpsI family protein